MRITLRRTIVIVTVWWLGFVILSLARLGSLGLLNVAGFSFLVFVPGALTLVAMRLETLSAWYFTLLAVGFSLLELITVALVGNTILPHLGVSRPLDWLPLVIGLSLLLAGLMRYIVWSRRTEPMDIMIRWSEFLPSARDKVLGLVPIMFVALAAMGATSLNNGGSNICTIVMLLGEVVFFALFMRKRIKLSDNAVALALYCVSLSLLFMTSLRGWHITGHDVEHEYRLFLLTANAGRWNISAARDAYNACLSITILPTVFYKLLDLPSAYVFKILNQMIFALAGPTVFLIARRYFNQFGAMLAAIYFVAFPTFFTDMPMLNRQEIAFVFLGVGVLALLSRHMTTTMRRSLFMLMCVGVILSHYATDYILLGLLLFCVLARAALAALARVVPRGKLYDVCNLQLWANGEQQLLVTVPMVVLLAVISFIWVVPLTRTYQQAAQTIAATVQNVQLDLTHSSNTAAAYYSFDALRGLDAQQRLARDFQQSTQYSRLHTAASDFYPASSYSNYQFRVIPTHPVPLTGVGAWLQRAGVAVTDIASPDIEDHARFLELMFAWGLVVMFFFGAYKAQFSRDYLLLQVGSYGVLATLLVMPVLLADYDVSRAFQQLLIVSGVPIVIGSVNLLPRRFAVANRYIALSAALIFFATSTGVFAGITGGVDAGLHLFNAGTYYDLYYTHAQEIAGARWLNALVASQPSARIQTEVYVDHYTDLTNSSVLQQNPINDLYPGIIRRDAYVFLGYTTVTKQQTSVFYNGEIITYQYPLQFLNQNKNLIYNNGGARVYR